MGAMQSQDFNMAKWAIGLRLPGTTDAIIEAAFNKGEILRTHVLRPTWHFVAAEDIYWMLEVTSPQMNSLLKSRQKQMELTKTIFAKSNSIIEKAVSGGKHVTREELMTLLKKAKIAITSERSYHLMYQAELNGIVCSGNMKGKNQTYTLLEERVKKTKQIPREEALAKLASRYFTSHCPATVEDFIWWSGLNITDGKHALEMIKNNFISETIKSKTYWFTDSFSIPLKNKSSLYLLPAFDEFIISYKDRTAILYPEHYTKVVSNNGIFWPVILMNGKAIGLWKRNIQKDKVLLEAQFFKKVSKTTIAFVEKRFKQFGNFLVKKTEIHFSEL
jgi:hypothetical protein